ncbi:MAG: ArnT family glycosyltransferase [Thermomicrobiales bacterium]
MAVTTAPDQLKAANPSQVRRRVRPQDWIWLATSILLSLALRIPLFGVPMIPDEGGYAYATRGWIDGTGHLYKDLWISRPQGIFIVYAGIMETLGTGTYAFRCAAWIAIALTTGAVWMFARMWKTPRVANISAIVFAILSASPNIEGFTANAEVFMGLPAAFAALWLLHISRHGWSPKQLNGVGILIGLATILKPSGFVMLPVAWVFILMIREEPARVYVRRCTTVLVGVVVVAIPIMIHGIYLGWSDFIYATVTYRLTQQSSASVGLAHNVIRLMVMLYSVWSMLLLLIVVEIMRNWRVLRAKSRWRPAMARVRKLPLNVSLGLTTPGISRLPRLERPTDDAGLILRLWVLGCLAGIAMGGDWWTHYLIQVAAPAAIWISAVSIGVTISLPDIRRKAVFVGIVVVLLLTPYWVLSKGSTEGMTQAMYGHPGYPAQAAVSEYLKDHTLPEDTIYVAFDQAGIYYLADRKPAYRYLYNQELRGVPASYSEIIAIIQGPNRPKYIVSTLHPGPFADDGRMFWHEVAKYYVVETTVEGVPVYRAKDVRDLPNR